MKKMTDDIERVLATKEELDAVIEKMGKILTEEYAGRNPLILCILKGAAPFASNLFLQIDCPAEMDFLQVSSYGCGITSNGFTLKKDIDTDIKGRDVIIVDDILDSGNTLLKLRNYLMERQPKSLKLCVLFDKPLRRESPIQADYVGLVMPDEFIVGYGLDYAESYRNLPYVGVLKPEIYTGKS